MNGGNTVLLARDFESSRTHLVDHNLQLEFM